MQEDWHAQATAGAQLFTVVGLDCLNVILTGSSWCTTFHCGGASWLFVFSVWMRESVSARILARSGACWCTLLNCEGAGCLHHV